MLVLTWKDYQFCAVLQAPGIHNLLQYHDWDLFGHLCSCSYIFMFGTSASSCLTSFAFIAISKHNVDAFMCNGWSYEAKLLKYTVIYLVTLCYWLHISVFCILAQVKLLDTSLPNNNVNCWSCWQFDIFVLPN